MEEHLSQGHSVTCRLAVDGHISHSENKTGELRLMRLSLTTKLLFLSVYIHCNEDPLFKRNQRLEPGQSQKVRPESQSHVSPVFCFLVCLLHLKGNIDSWRVSLSKPLCCMFWKCHLLFLFFLSFRNLN